MSALLTLTSTVVTLQTYRGVCSAPVPNLVGNGDTNYNGGTCLPFLRPSPPCSWPHVAGWLLVQGVAAVYMSLLVHGLACKFVSSTITYELDTPTYPLDKGDVVFPNFVVCNKLTLRKVRPSAEFIHERQ